MFARAVFCAVLLATQTANVRAADGPLRHLAFHYELGLTTAFEQNTSGMRMIDSSGLRGSGNGGGIVGVSGAAHQLSNAQVVDRGTIVADVLAATNDGGLIIAISESGRERKKPQARVGLREDGEIIAGAASDLFEEQRYLLALLARHLLPEGYAVGDLWRIEMPVPEGSSDVTTYKMVGGDAPILHLTVDHVVSNRSMRGYDLHITGTVDYDSKLLVPTNAKLHGILHSQGVDGVSTVTTDVVLSLVEDSFKH